MNSVDRHRWAGGRSLKEPGGGTDREGKGREGKGREGKSSVHRNQVFVQFSCPAGVYGDGGVKTRLVKSTGQCQNLEDVPFLNNLLQDGLQERNITIIVRKEIKTNCLTIKIYTKLPAKLKSVAPRKKKILPNITGRYKGQ